MGNVYQQQTKISEFKHFFKKNILLTL